MIKYIATLFCTLLVAVSVIFGGTTGKITGTVTDGATGEKLVGVNVVIDGSARGAITDIEGYYVILNVPPGTYTLKSSLIGYSSSVVRQVSIDIDQTTNINFSLKQTVQEIGEVVIVAQKPVVQKDVSSSRANINIKEIEGLPVASITAVIGLQAGVQGMTIRGGGSEQTAFIVDGMTLRDERDNTPYTRISLSAVQDVQVQTGGFNAEYGNIRSGVINVITKEGSQKVYNFTMTARMAPPIQKNFGSRIYGSDNYWIRPYVDPAVAWTGTSNGAWDYYTKQMYRDFKGWNYWSEQSFKDKDSTNDLSPEAAQRLALFQHRRNGDIKKSDFDIDFGFGGPFPFVSEELGNLRFFAAYRQTQSMYMIPLATESYTDYNGSLKITSDIGPGMKIMLQGLLGEQYGTNPSRSGGPGLVSTTSGVADVMTSGSYYNEAVIYGNSYLCPSIIGTESFGTKLTHLISSSTFYEASLHYQRYKYDTNPGRVRNTTRSYLFGNYYYVDQAPTGFLPDFTALDQSIGMDGFRLANGFANSRDTSRLSTYSLRFDVNSQLDRYNQIKAGVEFIYTENFVNYGLYDKFLPASNTQSKWNTYPVRGAVYVQDKLEWEGMIANLGVRVDYSSPGGYWYQFDSYDPALSGDNSMGLDTMLAHISVKQTVNVSPRLGIAFPVTENSKLFFNYGHFYQLPSPENLYLIRRNSFDNQVTRLADPNNPLPKTVAYELGYEHSLFDQFLIRIAGYYKDISNQITTDAYVSRNSKVSYSVSTPNSYADIRGFEITLSKNSGNWVTANANYTYMVSSSGRFGFTNHYESQGDQRTYERNYRETDLYQAKPIPRPFARLIVDLFTPTEYAPEWMPSIGPVNLLNDWRVNFTSSWQSGSYFTWAGGGSIPGILYNVQYTDAYYVDMRLSKGFRFSNFNLQFFMDVSNLLNLKNYSGYGFYGTKNFENYMKSLHLPDGIVDSRFGYTNIVGSDKPGMFRKDGVDYQPVETVIPKDQSGAWIAPQADKQNAFYFDERTKEYYEYKNNTWMEVDDARVGQMLEDKAYIFNPNLDYLKYLGVRQIYWGIKLNFEF